jgi:PKD repeat protein
VSSERHPEFTCQSPGVYEVCLTVSNFNGSHTHCKTIYGVTGSHNPVLQAALQVGPNPFAQRLTLTLSTPLASPRVQVLDVMGRTLVDEPIELGINELDAGHLPAGTYFWQVSTRTEGVVKSGKLVKM